MSCRSSSAADTRIETARAASPITHAADFPPTLLITGNKDELVPDEASFRMYRALIDAGAKAELHVYSEAPHAFDATPEFGRQTGGDHGAVPGPLRGEPARVQHRCG